MNSNKFLSFSSCRLGKRRKFRFMTEIYKKSKLDYSESTMRLDCSHDRGEINTNTNERRYTEADIKGIDGCPIWEGGYMTDKMNISLVAWNNV